MVTKGKIQESIVQENQQNSQIQAQSTEYFWYLTLSKEKEKCLKNLKFFSLRAATWNISTSRFEASVSRKTIFFLRLKWLSNLKREGNVILACLEVFFRQNISSWHTDSNAAQFAILCQEYMRKKRRAIINSSSTQGLPPPQALHILFLVFILSWVTLLQ